MARGRKDWTLSPGDPDHPLQQRIVAAVRRGDPRLARMEDCGRPGHTGHPVVCRHPACRVCLARERHAQRRRAKKRFENLDRDRLRSATLLLAAVGDLRDTAAVFNGFKKRLADMLRRQRRRDPRWEGVSFMLVLENGLQRQRAISALSRGTQRTLMDLSARPGECDAPIWLPHLHGLIHVGDVPVQEVRAALAALAPGHRAVHLEPLYRDHSVAVQVANVLAYAHKSYLLRRDPAASSGWADFDDEELALYVDWCGSTEGKFQRRRMWFGPTRAWRKRELGGTGIATRTEDAVKVESGHQGPAIEHRDNEMPVTACMAENRCPIITARLRGGPLSWSCARERARRRCGLPKACHSTRWAIRACRDPPVLRWLRSEREATDRHRGVQRPCQCGAPGHSRAPTACGADR